MIELSWRGTSEASTKYFAGLRLVCGSVVWPDQPVALARLRLFQLLDSHRFGSAGAVRFSSVTGQNQPVALVRLRLLNRDWNSSSTPSFTDFKLNDEMAPNGGIRLGVWCRGAAWLENFGRKNTTPHYTRNILTYGTITLSYSCSVNRGVFISHSPPILRLLHLDTVLTDLACKILRRRIRLQTDTALPQGASPSSAVDQPAAI